METATSECVDLRTIQSSAAIQLRVSVSARSDPHVTRHDIHTRRLELILVDNYKLEG
jgi:hypothetical protein